MFDVRETTTLRTGWSRWATIKRARIATRIVRLRNGLFGDAKSVGGGVSELRIDYGPGYRVYFTRRGQTLIFLLAGGDKRTQSRDIKTAIAAVADLE